uniref:hypothetical protein n=1 Tax=Castellaniella defragrans TaxID=75697 RepID=UPI00333E45E6
MTSRLKFTAIEADLLGRTADALCAYLGKPIIAEIVIETAEGFEWALFASPLAPGEDTTDRCVVQAGGPGARFVGGLGGLTLADDQPLECEFLWAIELSDQEGSRFIKVDSDGEVVTWTDDLLDILPFILDEAQPEGDEEDEAEDAGDSAHD